MDAINKLSKSKAEECLDRADKIIDILDKNKMEREEERLMTML